VDRSDAWHSRMRDWLATATAPPVVPLPVVQEGAYLVGIRLGPRNEATFIRIMAGGDFVLAGLIGDDLERAADLVHAYADLPLGFVDAAIVALAERLEITRLLTTDRRHFGVVRPAHVPRLTLVP